MNTIQFPFWQTSGLILCIIALASCSQSNTTMTYADCLQVPDANITDAGCTYKGVLYIAPVVQTSVSSMSTVTSSTNSSASVSSIVFTTSTSSAPSASSVPPEQVQIQVPFMSQAPLLNWDPPFDEACEEASVLMVMGMLQSVSSISPADAARQIETFVQWQTDRGYAVDVSVSELKGIVEAYSDYTIDIAMNEQVTMEYIQSQIAAGNPVIVPTAGQMLQNPYYSGDGPPYHMLVITGYNEHSFITNDPGTKRGASYQYEKEVLLDAIHDWNGSIHTIGTGKKAAFTLRAK